MRFANNVGNAGPHVRQTFWNDVFTFLMEVGNAKGRTALHIFGREPSNDYFINI
jgi:hypothetical protein